MDEINRTADPRPETVDALALRLADNFLRALYRRDGPWAGGGMGTTQGLAALIAAELHAWVRQEHVDELARLQAEVIRLRGVLEKIRDFTFACIDIDAIIQADRESL